MRPKDFLWKRFRRGEYYYSVVYLGTSGKLAISFRSGAW
jgi:hypothetical protein